MRLSEFWELADAVFGPAYARTLARQLILTPYEMTVEQSIEAGVAPRDVWHAWCQEMQLPVSERDGRDRERIVPPPR